jgi:hypothetical protein
LEIEEGKRKKKGMEMKIRRREAEFSAAPSRVPFERLLGSSRARKTRPECLSRAQTEWPSS